MTARLLRAAAIGAAGLLALSACGGGGGNEAGSPGTGAANVAVVLGTTDQVGTVDPAGSYDLPGWTIIYNTFQNLLNIPAGGNTPEPDAAKSCEFTDPTHYQCVLNDGLKFSDGSALTAKDVAFSFERIVKINDPNGPASLLANMDSVAATDDATVVFTLKKPDATWPFILATGAGAIVSSATYPAAALQPNEKLLGSGPYKLTKFTEGQQAAFVANTNYAGKAKLANNQFVVQYFNDASALKLAIEKGDVDVAYRSLSPTDITSLRGEADKGVKIVEGNGTEIRYIVFNVTKAPADNKAVRQAVAQVIDRDAIAKNAYDGTVTPLYSMIPVGLEGHTDSFKDKYGTPDVAKAKALLEASGVQTPVNLELWWTPSHYGPNSSDEYTEIKRQLDASGLFSVTLKSSEWEQYKKSYADGAYAQWELGWFPDFPDADNYTSVFLVDGGFEKNNYSNPTVNDLVAKEIGSTDAKVRADTFAEIQKITAEDVPLLPVWQGKQIAATRDNVTGVEKTFDPSFTFRFWLVGKSAS